MLFKNGKGNVVRSIILSTVLTLISLGACKESISPDPEYTYQSPDYYKELLGDMTYWDTCFDVTNREQQNTYIKQDTGLSIDYNFFPQIRKNAVIKPTTIENGCEGQNDVICSFSHFSSEVHDICINLGITEPIH